MKVGLLSLMASFLLVFGLPLGAMAGSVDTDGDTVPDEVDNCPTIANSSQANTDIPPDAAGDACDNCVALSQAGTVGDVVAGTADFCDGNSDGYGNLCDGDFNNDLANGIPDITSLQVPGLNMTVPPGNPGLDNNCDDFVGVPDITGFTVPQLNGIPGPSGLACAGPPGPPCAP